MMSNRVFVVAFSLLYLMIGAQSIGAPLGAGPDEPAHLVRAAGLVRGEVFGTQVGDQDATRSFEVPSWVGQPDPGCYAFKPEVPASCASVTDRGGTTISTAGSYQIWAHVLPGLGTLFPGGESTGWISRLLGALIPAGLVAAALAQLLARNQRVEAAAVLLALTPMALFSMAVVNPSGVAIGGAIALWVGGLGLSVGRGSAGVLCAAGWAALILARSDGWIWCAVIAGILLIWRSHGLKNAWSLLSGRSKAAILASTLLALAWSLAVRPALLENPESATGRALLTKIVGRTGVHLREAIGVLGWLDTSIPTTMVFVWLASVGMLFGVAVLHGERRDFQVLAISVGTLVVLPWIFNYIQASRAGLFWQGRYSLPLLVGVVIITGTTAGRLSDDALRRRLAGVVGVAAWLVWNVGFLQALRRWSVGESGSMGLWNWNTGIGTRTTVIVIIVHVIVSSALVSLVCSDRVGRRFRLGANDLELGVDDVADIGR